MSSKRSEGGCGEPWGLDAIPDWIMMISDRVLDAKCQLLFDHEDAHRNDLVNRGIVRITLCRPAAAAPLHWAGDWVGVCVHLCDLVSVPAKRMHAHSAPNSLIRPRWPPPMGRQHAA